MDVCAANYHHNCAQPGALLELPAGVDEQDVRVGLVALEVGTRGWIQRSDVKMVQTISLSRGIGTRTNRWEVLFTAPDDNFEDRNTFTCGG